MFSGVYLSDVFFFNPGPGPAGGPDGVDGCILPLPVDRLLPSFSPQDGRLHMDTATPRMFSQRGADAEVKGGHRKYFAEYKTRTIEVEGDKKENALNLFKRHLIFQQPVFGKSSERQRSPVCAS